MSSTAEASFSPWHDLLSFNNRRTKTHNAVRKVYCSCLRKTDCYSITPCCSKKITFTKCNHYTFICTWQDLSKELDLPVWCKLNINKAHAPQVYCTFLDILQHAIQYECVCLTITWYEDRKHSVTVTLEVRALLKKTFFARSDFPCFKLYCYTIFKLLNNTPISLLSIVVYF